MLKTVFFNAQTIGRSIVILMFALLIPQTSKAHQDRYYTFEQGNSVVRIKTGYEYEEIYKAEILASMLCDLSAIMNYEDNIQLDFIHDYTFDYEGNKSFVSAGKSQVRQEYDESFLSKNINGAKIIIRNLNDKIDFAYLLTLVEISITNLSYIKKHQSKLKFDDGYNDWVIWSIGEDAIENFIERADGVSADILSKKYYRIKAINKSKFTYYTKDGKFYFAKTGDPEGIILKTKDLFQSHVIEHKLIVLESPCRLSVYFDRNTYQYENYKHCEGAWNLFDFKSCDQDKILFNYRPTTSDDPLLYFRGVSTKISFHDTSLEEIAEFECDPKK